MDFEHILKAVGDFGPYQKRLVYFYLIPTTTIFAFYCMNTFFMLSAPDAWCAVPELENLDPKVQHLLSRPPSAEASHKLDQCRVYDIDYGAAVAKYMNETQYSSTPVTNFTLGLEPNVTTRTCDRWMFDKTNYDATAVTFHSLVCEREKWASLILTVHGIGEVLGNPFFGALADSYGRRPIFFFVLIVALSTSASPIIFTGLFIFGALRFLNSATAATLFNLPYIILTELVGPEHRTKLIGIGATTWTIGMCVLPYVAYLTRDWVILTVVPTVCVIPMFAYWNFLPESPRWLISAGKYQEAYDVMAKIAKVNGNPVPVDLMEQIQAIGKKAKYEQTQSNTAKYTIFDILRKPGLRMKFFIITLSWMANVTAYRGITLNFQNFEGSEFWNWFLLAAVEFPSNLLAWYLMETRLGRRWSNSLTMSLGGISLCLPLLLPKEWGSGVIVATLFGKFLCNMAYNVVYQQTTELFPTPVRNQGMSYSSAIAAGANFALPYLASLGKYQVWIPLLVMGGVCLSAGVAAAFLPETLHENLPQTIEDGEEFGKNRKFFSLAQHVKSDALKNTDCSLRPMGDSYKKVTSEL